MFYDIDKAVYAVIVRVLRRKPPHKTTEEMIKVDLKRADLDTCVDNAQRERIVLTRNGKPVALIVGVEGMDEEQLQLGSSDKFWNLISERRQQGKTTRVELERLIRSKSRR